MAKTVSQLVMEVIMNTESAEKRAQDLDSQIKTLRAGITQLSTVERNHGSTTETMAKKMEFSIKQTALATQKNEELKDEYTRLAKAKQDLLDKQEKGKSLTESEVKALDAYEDKLKRVSSEIIKSDKELTRFSSSSTALTREFESAGKAIDTNIRKTKEWADATERVKKGVSQFSTGWGQLESVGKQLLLPLIGAGGLGKQAFDIYQDYDEGMIGVKRLMSGSDEQRATGESSIDQLLWSRGEDNTEILNLLEVIVGKVDPSNYSKLGEYAEDLLNFAQAGDMSPDEAGVIAQSMLNTLATEGMGFEDLPNILSALNQMQNQFNTNIQDNISILERSLAKGLNAGFDYEEVAGIAGFFTNNSGGLERQGVGSNLGNLLEIVGRAQFNVSETSNLSNSEIKEIEQLQGDLMKVLGAGSKSEMQRIVAADPIGTLMALFKSIQTAAGSSDYSSVMEVIANKDYFGNSSQEQSLVAMGVLNADQIGGYVDAANKGYTEGTAVDDEAQEMQKAVKYQMALIKKDLQSGLKDVGEAITPHILAVLKELTPHTAKLKDLAEYIKKMDPEKVAKTIMKIGKGVLIFTAVSLGVKTIAGLTNIVKGTFNIISGGISKVIMVSKGLIGLAKGIKDVGLLATLTKSAVAGTTATTAAAGTQLATTGAGIAKLTALLGPLGVTLLATAGTVAVVTGAMVLLAKKQDEMRENAPYERLNDGQEAMLGDTVEKGRDGQARMNINAKFALETAFTDAEVEGLISEVDEMVNQAKERYDHEMGQGMLALTGNADLDARLGKFNLESQEEMLLQYTSLQDKQAEYVALLETIQELGDQATSKQHAQLTALKDDINVLYSQLTTGNESEAQRVYDAIAKIGDPKRLNNDEIKEYVEGFVEEIETLKQTHLSNIGDIEKAYELGEIDFTEYKLATEAQVEHYKSLDTAIRESVTQLKESRNWFDELRFDDKGLIGGSEFYDKDQIEQMANAQKIIDGLGNFSLSLVNEEDLGVAEQFLESLERIKGSDDVLLNTSRSLDVLKALVQDGGVEAIQGLVEGFGGVFNPEEIEVMLNQLANYYAAVDDLAGLDTGEKQLYIYTNFDTVISDIMTTHDLWTNDEFMDKLVQIDVQDEDAESKVTNLLTLYTDLPESEITQLYADNSSGFNSLNEFQTALQAFSRQNYTANLSVAYKTNPTNPFGSGPFRYKDGTDSHPGGPAIVGDGYVNEYIVDPIGNIYRTPAKPTLIPNLPQGVAVAKNKQTLMDLDLFKNIPKYKNGIGTDSVSKNETNNNVNINVTGSGVDANSLKKVVERELKRQNDNKKLNARYGGGY